MSRETVLLRGGEYHGAGYTLDVLSRESAGALISIALSGRAVVGWSFNAEGVFQGLEAGYATSPKLELVEEGKVIICPHVLPEFKGNFLLYQGGEIPTLLCSQCYPPLVSVESRHQRVQVADATIVKLLWSRVHIINLDTGEVSCPNEKEQNVADHGLTRL